MSYTDFLQSKTPRNLECGFAVDPASINGKLMGFQVEAVQRALKAGRYCLFEDCGLGKTPQQLEWARHISEHTSKPVLVLTPLAVAAQTKREGDKFDIPVTLCRAADDVHPGVNVANYEMLHHFNADAFGGIVLDESSILKNYSGSTRKAIQEFSEQIHFRLACSATPAPNDLVEIINHAEFHEVAGGKEIIATYFIQDGNTTHAWRLKRHAVNDFWAWVATWALALRKPSDLGYPDGAFTLPELHVYQHTVDGHISDGMLFPVEAQTLQERQQARRESLNERVEMAASLANATGDPMLVWCDLNSESAALTKRINGAVEVKGADSPEHKVKAMLGFTDGSIRVLVTKPSIAGFGMNWQHCNRMCFVGLSDSYEQFYQAVRRCYRYGQERPVHVNVICADTEGAVVANIQRKERQSAHMMERIVAHMNMNAPLIRKRGAGYERQAKIQLPGWIAA